MDSFKTFTEEFDFVDFILNEFNENELVNKKPKLWSAKKAEIMQTWKNLRPDIPIIIQPMTNNMLKSDGKSSYGEDGLRITGSWSFIASILARVKEIINYENENTRLKLVFREVDKSKKGIMNNKSSFVFYINLEPRASRKKN